MRDFFSNTSRCRVLLLLILIPSFLFTSCGKKWKKTTTVSVKFQLNSNSSDGLVKFTDGYFTLNKLKFTGDRKQGTHHIEQEEIFSNKRALLDKEPNNPGIELNIPQGTYSNIELQIGLDGKPTGTSLEIRGTYVDSEFDTIPVIFTLSADDVLSMTAVSASGGKEIVLVEDRPSSATFIINPSYWFATIPKNTLEDASENNNGNVQDILINQNENTEMYNLILRRIADGNQVVFD